MLRAKRTRKSTPIVALASSWAHFGGAQAICFIFFWLLNVAVILRGIETIRFLQGVSAPLLLVMGLALLLWAGAKAGGFGPMLATPSKFATFGEFFKFSTNNVKLSNLHAALSINDLNRGIARAKILSP